MVITAWILLVISTLKIIQHLASSYYVSTMNKGYIIPRYTVKPVDRILFYIAVIVFAVSAGYIFG